MTHSPPLSPIRALSRHLRWVVPGVLCLVAASGLAQSIPWLVKRAIDAMVRSHGQAPMRGPVVALVAVATMQALVRILSRIFIFNAGRETEYELRRDLFARLTRLDAGFFRRLRAGDLMSRLTTDLSSVRALLGAGLLSTVNTLFAYAVALPLMLFIDARLTLWALLPYPVLLLAARSFSRSIHERSARLQAALGALSATTLEDLAGWREVRSHAVEEVRSARLEARSAEVQQVALSLARWRAALIPAVGLASGMSLVIVLAVGGARVIEGRLTVGDLVAFTLYIGLLAWPTLSVGWTLSLWQRGRAAWHRLEEILLASSPLEDAPEVAGGLPVSAADPSNAPLLEVRGLTIDQRAPDGVSFRVEPGALCVVAGPVGAGKTMLAEAVARLLPVPRGRLFLDGKDVALLPVAAVRARIAYAPQSAFLFSASISDNIEVGLSDPSPGSPEAQRRTLQAARAAGLERELAGLPRGLETLVGERGLAVSGGQRQRVALARALISERPLLVLDDSLSAVDAETESSILDELGRLRPGRTILLVSHRVAALERADQIVLLEEGRVVEQGSHAELLARGGRYAALYRRQLLEEDAG